LEESKYNSYLIKLGEGNFKQLLEVYFLTFAENTKEKELLKKLNLI